MLSDRFYMRSADRPRATSFSRWLLCALAGVFVLQSVMAEWFQSSWPLDWGQLSARNVRDGRVWTLASYALLHGFLLHFLLNAVALYLFGRRLEERFSILQMSLLALCSALGGSLLWLIFHYNDVGSVAGASAVGMGFVAAFVWLAPREPLAFVPVPRYWLLVLPVGVDLAGLLLRELPLGLAGAPVSHSAHLGGVLGGSLFFLLHRLPLRLRRRRAVEPPAWANRPAARLAPSYTVNVTPRPDPVRATPARTAAAPAPAPREVVRSPRDGDELAAEVDRILDKIGAHGIASLSAEEQGVLEEKARRKISR